MHKAYDKLLKPFLDLLRNERHLPEYDGLRHLTSVQFGYYQESGMVFLRVELNQQKLESYKVSDFIVFMEVDFTIEFRDGRMFLEFQKYIEALMGEVEDKDLPTDEISMSTEELDLLLTKPKQQSRYTESQIRAACKLARTEERNTLNIHCFKHPRTHEIAYYGVGDSDFDYEVTRVEELISMSPTLWPMK